MAVGEIVGSGKYTYEVDKSWGRRDGTFSRFGVTQGVSGLIRRGPRGTFILDRVPKDATVAKGDVIVTRGTVDRKYPDYYPRGIPIGTVLSASASDIATFLTVQVTPFARFDSLDAVAALVPTKRK